MAYSGLKHERNQRREQTMAAPGELGLAPEPGAERVAGHKDLIAAKIADLRHYDVLGIDRVVAICCWGRSGSYLLASLLDGHDDVITMPLSLGELIYRFWEEHRHLSLREKLLAYPGFLEDMRYDATFFRGEFRIGRADYDASVAALLAVYGDRAPQVLESRGSFFRFLVVAYNLAFGRRPASPRPLIVHQQHIWSNTNAQRLVADFSDCRFIHTVRDPISCLDSTVEHFADLNDPEFVAAQYDPACIRRPRFNYPAWNAFWALVWRDAPHAGLQDRSVSVRFEDLHAQPRQTMGRVARWLGLSEGRVLLESTFNGKPWIVESRGKSWTGARLEQIPRRSRNMSWVDRTIAFALFRENLALWDYPYPRFFASRGARALCLALILAVPMRSEIVSDRTVMRSLLSPALRNAQLRLAARTVWRTLVARVGLRVLLFGELCRRLAVGKRVVKPI